MDSRPILKSTGKVGVFLDSKTFDDSLGKKDRLAFAILRHYDSDYLEFVRSPYSTIYDELKKVVEYKLTVRDSEVKSIEIIRNGSTSEEVYFGYKISQGELDKIIHVFIQGAFNTSDKSNIYITNDEFLLKNRLWFESHVSIGKLNIMSIDEASFF